MLLVAVVAFSGCKDDDDDNNDPIVLDGLYIKGAATALPEFNTNGRMAIARNEVTQEDRDMLYEMYIAVNTDAAGFNIVNVAGETKTYWGPGADFAEVAAPTGDEPQVTFWRGTYTESETPFTVPAEGIYHIALDKEVGIITIIPVEYWGLIGAATPGGWSADTKIMPGTFDLNTVTYSITDVEMTKADYKFRHSGGWKVEIDPDFDLGDGNTGIKVNTNFGGAVDALVAGGDNIANDVPGIYTVTMTWTLGTGFVATMTKTGNLATIDYTNTELGLVGDGLMVGGVQHNWDTTIEVATPAVDGTNFTWTWSNIEVTSAGSFKIREGQTWDNMSVGYPQVTMAGGAAANFETNIDGNFVPTVDGTYNITFFIDAVTETYTFTVETAK